MITKIKKHLVLLIIFTTLLLTFLLSVIVHGEISLLHFINISFYFSSAYLVFGLLMLVVEKGFFDGISYSFRRVFKRNSISEAEEDVNDIPPLSQIVEIPYSPLLYSGSALMLIMLVTLWFWYS